MSPVLTTPPDPLASPPVLIMTEFVCLKHGNIDASIFLLGLSGRRRQ